MRDWMLEHANISIEEYTNNMLDYNKQSYEVSCDRNNPDIDFLLTLARFSIKPNILKRKLLGITKNGTIYTYKGYNFELFSDVLNDPLLLTSQRYGECHAKSFIIAYHTKLDIVTAKCTDFYDGKDFIHTILVDKVGNKVFDYTWNLIIDKTTYYRIFNVREIKYLSNKEFKKYAKILIANKNKYGELINIREFLCYPEKVCAAINTLDQNNTEQNSTKVRSTERVLK